MTPPVLTVIAGANGSGKSTLTKWARDFFQFEANLDADAAAINLAARMPGTHGRIEAGKEVLKTAQGLLTNRVSFSVETTLSGNTYLRMMVQAKRLGYRIHLVYIGTADIAINTARIRDRVEKGGHDVPLEDQKRRYGRSLANLPKALALSDGAVLLDNSSEEGHRVIAVKSEGHLRFLEGQPAWASSLARTEHR
jgi:predicted ABC-type ATPase